MATNFDMSLPAGQAAPAVMISEDWAAPRPTPPPPPPARPAQGPPALELTDKRIKEAVAATVAAAPDHAGIPANQQEALRAPVLGAEQYKNFEKGFASAEVPPCLAADGLKFQPPRIGSIGFSGIFALPFLVVAAARGKCK
jgi:hypothetical protein